jgi:hypothetical protein
MIMKCRECPDYAKCAKESNLTIKRKNCPKAKTEKVKTNADRIRAMSDEELREFMCSITNCRVCPYEKWAGCGLLEWLKQPAE